MKTAPVTLPQGLMSGPDISSVAKRTDDVSGPGGRTFVFQMGVCVVKIPLSTESGHPQGSTSAGSRAGSLHEQVCHLPISPRISNTSLLSLTLNMIHDKEL